MGANRWGHHDEVGDKVERIENGMIISIGVGNHSEHWISAGKSVTTLQRSR